MPQLVHISTAHPPFDIRIFQKECTALANAGFQVGLIAMHDRDEERQGVHVYALRRRSNRAFRILLGDFAAFVLALRAGGKVFHLHDPELLPVGLALKLLGKRVIYDAHEDLPRQILAKQWIHPRLRPAIAAAAELFENFAARTMDAVVAATPHIALRFRRVNPRTVVVNNYPKLSEMFETSDSSSKERALCYVGAISSARGLTEMLRAAKLCDATLHLAGILSPPDLLDEINAAAAGGARVVYHGVLDRAGVARLMATSSVGIVCFHPAPNHLKSQPTKLFEYMSAGIPVVASDFEYWRDIVEKNDCGICVNPFSAEEIAAAADRLLSSPDAAARMGKNGRELVKREFSWEREEATLLKLYEDVVS